MKSCSIIRAVVGTGLVASFMLMQGCSYFGWESKPEEPPPEVPTPTEVTPPEVEPVPEIKPVAATTAYKVVSGDTISGIAVRYGLRWQDVVAVNPGITPNKIRVGQTIQLPGQVDLSKCVVPKKATGPKVSAPKTTAPKGAKAPTGPSTTYVVKSGDTLGGIAYRHGVKVAAIRSANNLTSDKLSINQKLTIPAGTKKVATEVKAVETPVEPVAPPPVEPVTPPPVEPVAPPPVDTNTTVSADPTAPVVPVTPVVPANTQTYTVKEGEDLYAVAIRWGVSPSDLKALNNLTSTDLKAGMVLQIPASAQ
jgi:peptidoglycan-N-acetylglucosamine deacetylase